MSEPLWRDGLSRVMPTVFVAGPAKSGSTFLWECIHSAFHPQRVCGSTEAAGWSDERCAGRRFVLPPLSSDVTQPACFRFEKESTLGTRLEGPTEYVKELLWVEAWGALVSGCSSGEVSVPCSRA